MSLRAQNKKKLRKKLKLRVPACKGGGGGRQKSR